MPAFRASTFEEETRTIRSLLASLSLDYFTRGSCAIGLLTRGGIVTEIQGGAQTEVTVCRGYELRASEGHSHLIYSIAVRS